jgi:glycosyltransferase involved in cell wall biosynthesis
MKILLISHGSTLEGAERSLFEAVQELTKKGEDVYVVVPVQGKLVEKLRGTISSIYILHTPWWIKEFRGHSSLIKRFYEYAKTILKLLLLLRRIRPDVVVTNTIVIPCGAIAASLLGIPHVWYIREFLEEDHGWHFEFGRQLSLRCINLLSQKVLVNSQAVYEKFSSDILSSKLRVVYNAVDVIKDSSELAPIKKENDTFYVVLIGRKAPGKGQKDAIEAISILVKEGHNVHLWLVGSEFDKYASELRAYTRELGVEQAVDFIPFVENPQQYLMAADAVLVCSRCEAFGRVTIEAMKFGKAVIGANSGSTPELIKDGWNGMLYEVSSPQSLAEKLRILSKDKDFRKQIEENADQWANSKFTLKNYSADLISVFQEVTHQE